MRTCVPILVSPSSQAYLWKPTIDRDLVFNHWALGLGDIWRINISESTQKLVYTGFL